MEMLIIKLYIMETIIILVILAVAFLLSYMFSLSMSKIPSVNTEKIRKTPIEEILEIKDKTDEDSVYISYLKEYNPLKTDELNELYHNGLELISIQPNLVEYHIDMGPDSPKLKRTDYNYVFKKLKK